MNSQNTIAITEARRRIFSIAEEVQNPGVYYTLTENGKPKMVLLSADEYESWMETMDALQEFPDLAKNIKKSEKDIRDGNYITLEELLLKEKHLKKK